MKKIIPIVLLLLIIFCACGYDGGTATPETPTPVTLPAPEVDTESQFGVDKNINISTIDNYLGLENVCYRDVRMLFDPADYGAIGGDADLSKSIEGFKIVPYPFIGTLGSLPVANAYEGETLFAVVWNADGTIESAEPNYAESMMVLEELFPRDKPIFLMCGGGGYAGMMKSLLLFLGWDEGLLYNIGANWEYKGEHAVELIVYPEDAQGDNIYATWRADYAYIDFSRLHGIET